MWASWRTHGGGFGSHNDWKVLPCLVGGTLDILQRPDWSHREEFTCVPCDFTRNCQTFSDRMSASAYDGISRSGMSFLQYFVTLTPHVITRNYFDPVLLKNSWIICKNIWLPYLLLQSIIHLGILFLLKVFSTFSYHLQISQLCKYLILNVALCLAIFLLSYSLSF